MSEYSKLRGAFLIDLPVADSSGGCSPESRSIHSSGVYSRDCPILLSFSRRLECVRNAIPRRRTPFDARPEIVWRSTRRGTNLVQHVKLYAQKYIVESSYRGVCRSSTCLIKWRGSNALRTKSSLPQYTRSRVHHTRAQDQT